MRPRSSKGTQTYIEHYHHERNRQSLDNLIPLPLGQSGKGVIRRTVE